MPARVCIVFSIFFFAIVGCVSWAEQNPQAAGVNSGSDPELPVPSGEGQGTSDVLPESNSIPNLDKPTNRGTLNGGRKATRKVNHRTPRLAHYRKATFHKGRHLAMHSYHRHRWYTQERVYRGEVPYGPVFFGPYGPAFPGGYGPMQYYPW